LFAAHATKPRLHPCTCCFYIVWAGAGQSPNPLTRKMIQTGIKGIDGMKKPCHWSSIHTRPRLGDCFAPGACPERSEGVARNDGVTFFSSYVYASFLRLKVMDVDTKFQEEDCLCHCEEDGRRFVCRPCDEAPASPLHMLLLHSRGRGGAGQSPNPLTRKMIQTGIKGIDGMKKTCHWSSIHTRPQLGDCFVASLLAMTKNLFSCKKPSSSSNH
jgi:hypothetical protein